MELRHLRYFVTVAGLLNFSAAARRLHVAQPALSRQMQDLEEELGVQLFERDARPIRLTAAGAVFLPEAQAVLDRAEQAVHAAKAAASGSRGEVRVGYAPTPSVEILPCALHVFQNAEPRVKVVLNDLSTDEMLRGLQEATLEVCLLVQPAPRALGRLQFEPLRAYPVCAAVRPGHPLARAKRVTVEQLASEPMLAFPRRAYPDYHAIIDRVFGAGGRAPNIAEEHDSFSGILAAAEIGRGWMLGPACLAAQVGQRLQVRPLHPAPAPIVVGMAWNPRALSRAGEAFLQAARGAATKPKE